MKNNFKCLSVVEVLASLWLLSVKLSFLFYASLFFILFVLNKRKLQNKYFKIINRFSKYLLIYIISFYFIIGIALRLPDQCFGHFSMLKASPLLFFVIFLVFYSNKYFQKQKTLKNKN